jgi:hypothetical protein
MAFGLATAVQAQCPGEGDCCEDNGSVGCDDVDCCTIVCTADPFCCSTTWDGACAGQALELCGDLCSGGGGGNDNCADAIEIFNGATDFSNVNATNDGPELPAECDEGFGTAFGSDIWYVYNSGFNGTLTVSTCDNATFDTRLAAYQGACDQLVFVACNDDGEGCAGFTSILEVPVVAGESYLIRVGGFGDPGAQGTGTLTLTKDAINDACPGEGCCYAANGTPGCDDAQCCNDVCAADGFCCDNEWDEICADMAISLCFSADCSGDTNGDNTVDVSDLTNVILDWGQTGSGLPSDVAPDCEVNVGDLTAVILGWGPCCAADGCGGCDAGDCFEPNGTPYCDDLACCEAICALDGFCCDVEWDGICADAASQVCAPGACCFTDGSCIDVENGGDCVNQGGVFQGPGSDCGSVECPILVNDNCEDRIPLPMGSTAYTTIGSTFVGPDPGCAAFGSDVWYNFTAEFDGTVEINTCDGSTTYDSALAVYLGCECPADVGTLITCNDDFCGLQSRVVFDVTAGQCYKVQVGGFAGAQGTGTLVVMEAAPICGEGAGDCFIANGTPGCDDIECCQAVCAIDAFCCDVSWDQLCADQAIITCDSDPSACCFADGTCEFIVPADCVNAGGTPQGSGTTCESVVCIPICGEGAGDCFVNNGTPGCDDVECCLAVCAQDPFCCDVSWDGICADEALITCDSEPSACCFPDGTCQEITPADCVNSGGTPQGSGTLCKGVVCIPICGEGAGDCFVDNGTPGCDDVDCCNAVCAQDAFCCDVAWDAICADTALITCDQNPQACCFCDGICEDITPAECINAGGTLQGSGTTCASVECPIACEIVCESGTDEGEDCGADTNGGCNVLPTPTFGSIACDETVCGTAWADGGTRDTDWFLFSHKGGVVSASLVSAFPGAVFIVDVSPCPATLLGSIGSSSGCGNSIPAVAELPAGEYAIVVLTAQADGIGIFDGYPCCAGDANANAYTVTLTCGGELGTGACCIAGFCEDDFTSFDCTAVGGTYSGDDSDCASTECPACGTANAGDCCDPAGNGTPFCDDLACCELVCAADPFCCDTSWDGICAGAAAIDCEICVGAAAAPVRPAERTGVTFDAIR